MYSATLQFIFGPESFKGPVAREGLITTRLYLSNSQQILGEISWAIQTRVYMATNQLV